MMYFIIVIISVHRYNVIMPLVTSFDSRYVGSFFEFFLPSRFCTKVLLGQCPVGTILFLFRIDVYMTTGDFSVQ